MCDQTRASPKVALKGKKAPKAAAKASVIPFALPRSHEKLSSVPADHHDELKRVNRIIGQLEGVKRMIEERRYCIDILTQTRAVSAALRSLESSVLRGHMKHCLHNALTATDPAEVDTKIEELIDLFNKK